MLRKSIVCPLFFLVLVCLLRTGNLPAQSKRKIDNAIDKINLTPSILQTLDRAARQREIQAAAFSFSVDAGTGKIKYARNANFYLDRDSLARMNYLRAHSDISSPVFSTARDSVVEDFSGGKTVIYYYGDVNVKYDNLEIKADYMEYNVDTKIVFARGTTDSTGTIIGKPEMKEGNNNYVMESVYYNFSTKKARINNMITQDDQGYLHGKKLKKMPDNSINITRGKYTTCDAEHPHFYLSMTNAKVTTDANGKPSRTIFGPAYVVVEDVPTPIAIPFGFVPKRNDRSGGLLIPTYGEETNRGFFLKGLGYYLVFGDYLDLSLTGDIYTLGSWNIQATSRYKVKYKFNGSFNMNYSKNITGEKGSTDYTESGDFSVRWTHTQDSKARPGTNFSASVNFSSPTNNKYNCTSVKQALENQTSSNITYGKTFAGTPFNFSINLLHSQNSRDSSYALTLPNLTFTMNRIFPFKRKERVGKERFYESISLSYNTTFVNKLNFTTSQLREPDFWRNLKSGMTHKFAIGLPSLTLLKYIHLTPSVNYGMNWMFQSISKEYDPESQKVVDRLSPIFGELGVTQDYSFGLSATTKLYGMFNFGKKSRLQVVRHMMTPSISLSIKPEMGTAANGYTSYTYVDAKGEEKTIEYNKYKGAVYGPPSKGKTAALSFSLGNNLEAKVLSKKDTTNGGIKKVKLIDNLSLSGSYNFLADSMKLSNIGITMSTSVFGKLGLNGNITLNPYAVDGTGRPVATLNVVQNGRLARLTNASFSTSYQFQGGKQKGGGGAPYQLIYENPITHEYIPGGWVYYMDPDIPWSVNLNYSYSYSRSYTYANQTLNTNHNHTMTLGVSAQVKLTKDFSLNLNSGIDLMKMKLTTTQLSASYDLHCFQISVSWVPTGQWESWSFRINAKASALADLLQYRKNASYWDK